MDETVFTVGPDSEIMLDEFVYDPFTDAGKVTAQVTKGVFRFVTGKVARKRPAGMTLKLPVGTVGIRGTIAGGRVEADGSSLVALLGPGMDNNADEKPGAVIVENAGGSTQLDTPGTGTRVAPGQPPSAPFTLTPELLASLSVAPSGGGAPDQSGGGAGSASQESGQETAAGTAGAADAGDVGETEESGSQATSIAAQDTLSAVSKLTSWDEVRRIQSGTAFYEAFGSYHCTGGVCSTGNDGTWTVHFNVDFGARTLGGGGSASHVAFDGSGTGCLNTGGGAPALYEATIPVTSFASLDGQAKMTVGADFSAANGNTAFNGTTFQFEDGAKHLTGNLSYNGSNQNGGSSAYVSGASAGGTASGGCASGSCP
jgi:hypothetical protein